MLSEGVDLEQQSGRSGILPSVVSTFVLILFFLASYRELGVLKARLKQAAQGLQPAIYRRRTREAELLQELGIRVLDWQELRQSRDLSQRLMNLSGYAHTQPRMSSRVCVFYCHGTHVCS